MQRKDYRYLLLDLLNLVWKIYIVLINARNDYLKMIEYCLSKEIILYFQTHSLVTLKLKKNKLSNSYDNSNNLRCTKFNHYFQVLLF